jgi:hypothetical protein
MPGDIRNHNVYILGAGFSREAGAPLIHDFLDKSREFFDDPESALDPQERQLFEEVFRFKREVAKAREKFRIDLDDIEAGWPTFRNHLKTEAAPSFRAFCERVGTTAVSIMGLSGVAVGRLAH